MHGSLPPGDELLADAAFLRPLFLAIHVSPIILLMDTNLASEKNHRLPSLANISHVRLSVFATADDLRLTL